MRRGVVVALVVGVVQGCTGPGEPSGADPFVCEVEEALCPPGTRPMSLRDATEQGFQRVELEELGVVDVDGLVYRRLEDEDGGAYACMQEVACPEGTQTCFHGACFGCLPPGSDLCLRECSRF